MFKNAEYNTSMDIYGKISAYQKVNRLIHHKLKCAEDFQINLPNLILRIKKKNYNGLSSKVALTELVYAFNSLAVQ